MPNGVTCIQVKAPREGGQKGYRHMIEEDLDSQKTWLSRGLEV